MSTGRNPSWGPRNKRILKVEGIIFPSGTMSDYVVVTGQDISGTVASSAGTITTVGTATISYVKTGRDISWQADITIAINGTGAGLVGFTFPFSVVGAAPIHGSTDGFVALAGYVIGTAAAFAFYDGTYPGADGARFFIGGNAHV